MEEIKRALEANRLSQFATADILARLEMIYTMMVEFNAQTNLTAITEPSDAAVKHFADCLAAAAYIPEGASVVDVGCGGGFPTLPLAAARPDLKITALDSTGKKLVFVKKAAAELSLAVDVFCGRAEDVAHSPQFRARYDVAVSRAVAAMPALCEYCLGFVRVGGTLVAMKGDNAAGETAEAKKIISDMGGSAPQTHEYTLFGLSGETFGRTIITVEKPRPTPAKFPRNNKEIIKGTARNRV